MDPPEVNSIHQAVVEKVAHFGIFVKMKGFAKSGLVYSSQARALCPKVPSSLRLRALGPELRRTRPGVRFASMLPCSPVP